MKPIINNSTNLMINKIIKNFPQSLLITGEKGVGLSTIANYICESLDSKPFILLPEKNEMIDFEKGVISVDGIRHITELCKSKITNKRIIIIDYGEKMTIQAQNAFLKLLEEPNENTHFIIVSCSINKLLPTILSRTEKINIKPITYDQSNKLLDSLGVTEKIKRSQLLFIAEGKPAELTRLSKEESYFQLRSNIIKDARELLGSNTYNKLLLAQKYNEDRNSALSLINDACKILKISIINNPHPQLLKIVDSLVYTYKQIEANGNIRLCIARISI
ncbi:MAG TPA: AAA family ATPase [Candidatus Saccharibacteria bacterium]|nr:AAA family ATPase [Candidatus Saccharibacteria bacterium]